MMRGGSAVTAWARADIRARWVSLVALGLLAGVTAGVALAALGGAVRTDDALDRLRDRQISADAVVFAGQTGQFDPDWDALAAAPEVDTVAPWALVFGTFSGKLAEEAGPLVFAGTDERFLHDTNRPIVVEGRMFDPVAPDEMVIDENVPAELVDVGDVVPFHAYGPDQEPGEGEPTGPEFEFRVVGRVKTMNQFLFLTEGQVVVSPGLVEQFGDQMIAIENADVRLVDGAADNAALERTVTEVIAPGTPVLDLNETARRVETTMAVERTALLTLAAVVALVGSVLVAQALGRSASAIVDDAPVLRAVGMTRADLTVASVLVHLPVALVAVLAAAVSALVASIWFPVGVAGRVDPDRGLQATWAVLVPGLLVVPVLVAGAAAITSSLAVRRRPSAPVSDQRGWLARGRAVAPLAVGIGTTMALRAGTGRSRVPVRPALVGAVVGVLGVTAALTITRGLEDTLDHPERAGVVWDAEAVPLPDQVTASGVRRAYVSDVAAVDGVADTAIVERALVEVEGAGEPAYAVRPTGDDERAAIALALTTGRAPAGEGEVALGPATADRLDARTGDSVSIGERAVSYRVTGEVLFPTDVHAAFDDGIWLTPEGLEQLLPPPDPERGTEVARLVVVRFDEGAPTDATVDAIGEAVGDRSADLYPASPPPELTNLREIRTLPTLLAVFLAGIAVAALAHVLATSARRRSHEFAVLRALGVTRRSVRSVLNAQGSIVGLVGLLLGVPLGIVLGRMAWRVVAERVPLAVVEPWAVLALLLVVPVTLLVANLAAVWPGRRVSRQHPATVLRTE